MDEVSNTLLKLSVFDKELFGRGEFLGKIELSFLSLLLLHDGVYDFSLIPDEKSQHHIKGI